MISCIVFDFDGTLVQSNEIKRRAYFDVATDLNFPTEIVKKVLARQGFRNRFDIIDALIKEVRRKCGSTDKLTEAVWSQQFASRYTAICQAEILLCPEIPGATDTLITLSEKQYRIYVSSATPGRQLKEMLDWRKFEIYLAGSFGSEHKKTENLSTIMKIENLSAENILVVGDSEDDRASSSEMGCHFVGIEYNNSGQPSRFSVRPHQVISDLRGFVDIVTKLGKRRTNFKPHGKNSNA